MDKAGDLLTGKALHLVLELQDAPGSFGHRPSGIYYVVHFELTGQERVEVLMISGKREGSGRVPAHVENYKVPVAVEGRAHLSGHVRLRKGRAREGGGDEGDLLFVDELYLIGHAEIVVYTVEVYELDASALRSGVYRQIEGDLCLSGAVVADQDYYLFHFRQRCPIFSRTFSRRRASRRLWRGGPG